MTQQDDITQRVLPAEHHLNELMRLTQPWPNATIPCATVRSHVEQALSKLRAPVAYERPLGAIINGRTLAERLEAYGFECEAGDLRLCNDWVEFRRCFEHLAEWASTLASAPVAGEARTEGGDPASPRDDSDRTYDKPIGYLPAYELGRLHSGHSANLRSAKFGPSALDGDVPVYLEPPNGDAAPQASECECSRKSKAVSDSEAQL